MQGLNFELTNCIPVMSLRGRPPGRDERQEQIWSENEKKIVYALMDTSSNSARLNYLEERTGLTRRVLKRHLDELEFKGIIREENGVFSLNTIFRFEKRANTPLEQDVVISIPDGITEGIAVVRAQANNVFNCKVYGGDRVFHFDEEVMYTASTIPFDSPQLTIKFSSTEEQTRLSFYQIMVFSRLQSQE